MKIMIYANCQGLGIQNFLQKKVDCKVYSIEIHKYFHQKKQLPKKLLGEVDVFIYIFIGETYGELSTDPKCNNIFKYLKKDCLKIGFPGAFQSAFWPIIPGYGSCRDGHYVIKDLKKNHSLEEILNMYDGNKIDFKLGERFDKCETHTKEKEKYYSDENSHNIIEITPFIRKHHKKKRLFVTHNHPTNYIFLHITNRIIQILNEKLNMNIDCYQDIFSYPMIDNPIDGDDWPDSKYVVKELNVEFIKGTNEQYFKYYIKDIFKRV